MNSLWFLSLVIGLSCALLAISLQQWARRYIRLTRPARCSPEKRARIRAFYANGVDKMHVPWAVEGLPTLLHLSLFLFFGGLVILLFNIDREVFTCVFLWIGLFSMVYGLITLLPLIRRDSPYFTPLSILAWFLFAKLCTTFQFLSGVIVTFVTNPRSPRVAYRVREFYGRHSTWGLLARMLGGMENMAEEMAEKQSSEIDIHIFSWTVGALLVGDDNSLEKFFEAIPGLFNSMLVNNLERDIPASIMMTFWKTLNRFMDHTSTSNSVARSVKSHRDIICREIVSMIPHPWPMNVDNLQSHFHQAPVSIERLQSMARWRTNDFLAHEAKRDIIFKLPRIPKRDGRWIALVRDVLGLNLLQRYVFDGGDDASLATLIDICRQFIPYEQSGEEELVKKLAQVDIRHTLPELQHEFCALWNEVVQEIKDKSHLIDLLQTIHHLYIALHPGTDAAPRPPTAFSSTRDPDSALFRARPRTRPSYPLCDITGHRPEKPIIASGLLLDFPFSALPVVSFSSPSSPSPSHVPSLPNAGLLTLFSSATPPHPSDNPTLLRLRARGLVNAGSSCFSNAVLQLLMRTPPFWNLIRKLGDQKGQRGETGLETGCGAAPLVDAMVRFSEEFMFEEKEPPSLQQLPQPAAEEKPREDQEAANVHNCADPFEPVYMYDAIKGKRQLKNLLVRSHGRDAPFCY